MQEITHVITSTGRSRAGWWAECACGSVFDGKATEANARHAGQVHLIESSPRVVVFASEPGWPHPNPTMLADPTDGSLTALLAGWHATIQAAVKEDRPRG